MVQINIAYILRHLRDLSSLSQFVSVDVILLSQYVVTLQIFNDFNDLVGKIKPEL